MIYTKGIYKNGKIELFEPLAFEDNTELSISILSDELISAFSGTNGNTLTEIIGTGKSGKNDISSKHDKYLKETLEENLH